MKTHLTSIFTVALAMLAGLLLAPQNLQAHGSEASMKAYMEPYGKIQVALAGDDLAGAQAAAKTLPLDKDAQAIAASSTLDDARKAFKSMSKKAVAMAADDEGYYTFKCPMVEDGYWIQSSTKTNNPYLGKSMPGCGKMLSKEDAMKMAPGQDKAMPGM